MLKQRNGAIIFAGKPWLSIRLLKDAIPQARKVFLKEKMISKDPAKDDFTKAKEAFRNGHYTQVINLLSDADLEGVDPEKKAEVLAILGISLSETGNLEEALKKLKEALALDPHHALALDGYGDLLQRQGKFHAAITKYRAAVSADPNFWEPYFQWGYILKKMGNPKPALRKLLAALARNPEHVESYIHAGDCAFQLSFHEQALAFYAKAEEKGSESAEISTRIGNVYLSLGDRQKAVEAYQKAVKIDPMEGSGYENWGLVFHQEGKLQEAERKFQEGLIHAPHSPTLLLRHGEVLVALGKYKEALNPLLKGLELLLEKMNGEWGVHWAGILADCGYMLGFVQKKLGDEAAAKEYYLMALRYAPNHLDVLAELAVLRGVYREHHVKWDFVLEGKVESEQGKKTGLRAYRVTALTLDEALRYAEECEEEIQGNLKAKEVSHTEQVASYAGVLARGPLFLVGRASKR